MVNMTSIQRANYNNIDTADLIIRNLSGKGSKLTNDEKLTGLNYVFTSNANVYNSALEAYNNKSASVPDTTHGSCVCSVKVGTYAKIHRAEVLETNSRFAIVLIIEIGAIKENNIVGPQRYSTPVYGAVYWTTYSSDGSVFVIDNKNNMQGDIAINANTYKNLSAKQKKLFNATSGQANALVSSSGYRNSFDQTIHNSDKNSINSSSDLIARVEDGTLTNSSAIEAAEAVLQSQYDAATGNAVEYIKGTLDLKSENLPVNFATVRNDVRQYKAFLNTEASNGLRYSELRGVFGAPYQFLPTTDYRYTGKGMSKDLKTAGYTFARKIGTRMPLLYITPGNSSFMAGANKSSKQSLVKSVMSLFSGSDESSLSEMLDDYTGKLYTIMPAYAEYFTYVNPMCRMGAIFLDIADKTYCGVRLDEYNWALNEGQAYEFEDAQDSTDNESDQEEMIDEIESGEPGNFVDWAGDKLSEISYFQQLMYYKNAIPFFINSDVSFQDSFSNEVGESSLASVTGGLSDKAREMQFLLGTAGNAVGRAFDRAASGLSTAKEAIDNLTNKIANGNSIFSTLVNSVKTIVSGGRIIFPQIWTGAGFSRQYSITIRFTTPSYDPYSWWLNIYVPICHLAGLVMPRSEYVNSYTAPFLVKAFYKGMFNVDMGIITDMSITKGKEGGWTADGLPTVVEVQFTIQDLYSEIGMTSTGSMFKGFTLQNIAEMDYFANLCGINFNEPDVFRMVELWHTFQLKSIKDMPTNFGVRLGNIIGNKLYNTFQNWWYA